jgi:hypothetical protein
VPPIAFLARGPAPRLVAIAAATIFAAFVAAKGIPTLRHDWTWPIDRNAIPSFMHASFDGWVSAGLGTPNPHPTTYLIALPLGTAMWLFGPLVTLALLAAVIGYVCMRRTAAVSSRWSNGWPAALGIGLFALFNPWVYNEVVAGHLVMVLAYGGLIGLFAEMLGGRDASPVRLALWAALIEAQLQFFLVAMLALFGFAVATKKWLPLVAGAIFALPSIVGLVAERGTLLRTPYIVEWQTNQSVAPVALLGLGGYFPGYADRLGIVAPVAVWLVLGLAVAGALLAFRSRAVIWTIAAAAFVSVAILGVHGPFAVPYAWIVRNVPESGVFRELYDLAGVLAALLALLAGVATARVRGLGYVALVAGMALPASWVFRPPSDLWIGSSAYPHPVVAAPPFTRVAFLPAFQPLSLRNGGGDGADPDAFVYPGEVPTLNEYLPTYPVDMALARYEQSGDAQALRALGVAEVVARPWLVSKTQGGIGLAATSLESRTRPRGVPPIRYLSGATPLLSQCETWRVVGIENRLGACDVFFGDAPGYLPIRPVVAPSDSIDPRTAWIDARLAFAEAPDLAQAIGGALTQSTAPLGVEANSWLFAYVRGALVGSDGRELARSRGAFVWLRLPAGVTSVACMGLCELVAKAVQAPDLAFRRDRARTRALEFRRFASWLYVVAANSGSQELLRFNDRYDPAWVAFAGGHALQHVRVDMAVNGWLLGGSSERIILVQVVALLQLVAEICGVLFAFWLLKALQHGPTKRAP